MEAGLLEAKGATGAGAGGDAHALMDGQTSDVTDGWFKSAFDF